MSKRSSSWHKVAIAEPVKRAVLKPGRGWVALLVFAFLVIGVGVGAVLGWIPVPVRASHPVSGALNRVVHFRSEPSGATVSIEGEVRGVTPLDLPNGFPEGPQKVTFAHRGYESFTMEFAGRLEQTIEVTLTKKH